MKEVADPELLRFVKDEKAFWAMKFFPSQRDFRSTVRNGVAVALVCVSLVWFSLGPLTGVGFISIIIVLGALIAFLASNYRALKNWGYDEKGVYQGGRILFPWTSATKISMGFENKSGEFIVYPLLQTVEVIDYRISLVFALDGGKKVVVKSNLDMLIKKNIIENINEIAKAANPKIEFE